MTQSRRHLLFDFTLCHATAGQRNPHETGKRRTLRRFIVAIAAQFVVEAIAGEHPQFGVEQRQSDIGTREDGRQLVLWGHTTCTRSGLERHSGQERQGGIVHD